MALRPTLSPTVRLYRAGLPVGAFGGRQEVMSVVSPDGPVYQAGTLSGNPLAMAAGYTLLSELNENRHHYDSLEKKAAYLQTELLEVLKKHEVNHHINCVGSMSSIFFTDQRVTNFATANTTDKEFFKTFFHEMSEAWYLSTPITI
ncbi:MAG: aminotransferase class III-fold pyridoxal phosphate-dependent enzyme [Balneolaceae bacterium]|nr:aminotransferase class III-fold pyridoxal phosphate-dependent enzyme [Balneolaceae bacterium]